MRNSTNGLILATQSSYKRELMERLGVPFECDAAHVDESQLEGELPQEMAPRLAALKATTVAARHPGKWVLGADQTIFFENTTLGKPGDFDRALAQLKMLRGRTHTLLSAIALVSPGGQIRTDFATTQMDMRDLSDEALSDYLRIDEPFDCAGSYKVESAGIRLFSRMNGDDYTNIIGLPLTRVADLLFEVGLM